MSAKYRGIVLALGLLVTIPATPAVWAQDQGSAEVSLSRGLESFGNEDYSSARRHFETALAREPEFAASHYFLGLTLMQSASQATGAARTALFERAAAEFEQSRLRDPQLVLAHLNTGIVETILGRFSDAEQDFQAFLAERPDDPMPYLFLAVAYYRQARADASYIPAAVENLDKAETALGAAPQPDRSLEAYVKFYRGLLFLLQNQRAAARETLQESHDLAPDLEIGRQSQEILDRLVERRPWDLSLRMGLEYDTNVLLRGHDVPDRTDDGNNDDTRFGLACEFDYRLIDTEQSLLGVGLESYNSWHTDIDDYDVQTYGASVYGAYAPPQVDWLTLSLRYDYSYTYVGNDSYMSRHRVTPQIGIRETGWSSTALFYQYEASDFKQDVGADELDRSGNTHAVGILQQFEYGMLFDRPITTDLGYRYENVATDGTEFDTHNNVFTLAVGVPLPRNLTFDFINEFEMGRYRHGSLFDQDEDRRRDCLHTMVFSLTKEFSEQLSARFRIITVDADSNVEARNIGETFSYRRFIYGLSVHYRF